MNNLKELYRAEQLPIFQNHMFNSEFDAINCHRGDILLTQDLSSGLIFNKAFKPELMQYGAEYQNEQGFSPAFQHHLNNISTIIKRHFQSKTLIEVGCGKGHFLEKLQNDGFEIIGLDPTYEGFNPKIIKEYFTSSTGLHADGIILRHVLEHIQNPVHFLSKLLEANGGKGKIYIEVPCFDWICQRRAWFDIFYEHVNYFRINDLKNMFGHIYEIGHVFGDQYLYIVADLATIKMPVRNVADNFEFPNDFLKSVEHCAYKIHKKNNTLQTPIIWGGASKGVIFALFMQRAKIKIDYIVDINPAKQGKYLAATGLKVSSPDIVKKITPYTDIFVMNSNYLPEIKKITNNQFNYITVDYENF